ncbi:stathmin-2-like protein [Leptotrombidium deliense]|uniref:Stathmin n=1 Tax=Leptotrombidium deliense TaxID=299467 RepID=A0A443S522_9ACAR|nr:stathmin-2-like protein [Leptotrombidium deliense]
MSDNCELTTEPTNKRESKGGIQYELVLENPTSDAPSSLPFQSPSRQISVEDIENKLKAAEERRRSMEAQKINQLKEKENHILELKEKRNEFTASFIESARDALEKKMEISKEKRDTFLKGIQDKSREHEKRIAEVRQNKTVSPQPTGGDVSAPE